MTELTSSSNKKKRNPFVAYFVPFGLRKASDLLMIVGAIMIFIGLFVHGFRQVNAVIAIGLIMYLVASGISIFRCVTVLQDKEISTKAIARRNAIINIVIMGVVFVLAVLGLLAAFNIF